MEGEESDVRMNHIEVSARQILNFQVGFWKDIIWKEENVAKIKDFLDTPTTQFLFVHFEQNEDENELNDTLVLSLELPKKRPLPNTVCYFQKNTGTVSMTDYKTEISFGNICDFSVSQCIRFFEMVSFPLFRNTANNERWPKTVVEDVISHFEEFYAILSYHVGLAKGITYLRIPESAKMIKRYNVVKLTDRDCLNWEFREALDSIAKMLVNWNTAIRQVLELTSEDVIVKIDKLPSTEVAFWEDRKVNLEFIYAQMNEKMVKRMVLALERMFSCHLPMFRKLLQDVAEAVEEAREVSSNYKTMSDKFEELETVPFPELLNSITEAFEFITLSWINSKYFNTLPSRITVLIQKTCCLLIVKARTFLNPTTIFKDDRQKMKDNVCVILEVINLFIESYHTCRKQYHRTVGEKKEEMCVYPWQFPDERVFEDFNKFITRLKEIDDLFSVANIYFSIQPHKMANLKQAFFRKQLEVIKTEFAQVYSSFENLEYDPLDLESKGFVNDYAKYTDSMKDLDRRLGIALAHAFISSTPENACKLMEIFRDQITHRTVENAFKSIVSSHIANIRAEVENAREKYDVRMLYEVVDPNGQFVYKNLPPTSASLQWSQDIQRKLSEPVKSLQELEYFAKQDDAHYILRDYEELTELLKKYEKDNISIWQNNCADVWEQLNQPLFIEIENIVSLNFYDKIFDATRERNFLKQIMDTASPELNTDKEIPKNILLSHALLSISVRWYNDMNKNLIDYEKNLISDRLENVTTLLKEGYSKNWTSSDLQNYAEMLYDSTKQVFESVNEAKKNIQHVKESIETWNKIPMYKRETPSSLIDLEIKHPKKADELLRAVTETAQKLKTTVEGNQTIFGCNADGDEWKNYISSLELIFEEGLKDGIRCSLQYLKDNMDSENEKLAPFLKIYLKLDDGIRFAPSLEFEEDDNLFELLDLAFENIYTPARETRRINDPECTYYDAIREVPELEALKTSIQDSIESATNKALEESENFNYYGELWLKNVEESLEDFVLNGPVSEMDEFEDISSEESAPVGPKPPTEEEFKAEISQLEEIRKKAEEITTIHQIESWFTLDQSLFRNSFSSIAKEWISKYKKKFFELKSLGLLQKPEEEENL